MLMTVIAPKPPVGGGGTPDTGVTSTSFTVEFTIIPELEANGEVNK